MIKNRDMNDIIKQLETANLTGNYTSPIYTDSNNKEVQALCAQLNILFDMKKDEQKAYNQVQDNYQKMLSNISHDLKTPLTVMSGLLELIDLEKRTSDENQQFLNKIEEKTQDLTRMINDFFDLTKLESQDTKMEMTDMNILEICRKVILNHYDVVESNGLKMDIDMPQTPIIANVNEQAMERILNNLLTNAIAYGADGGVIGLRVKELPKSVEIIVWDKGKGIEEKYYNQVFERLFTLEDSRNKHYSGSGLGLTIIKRLTENQGGKITLQSVPNQYTEFKVTFPKIS